MAILMFAVLLVKGYGNLAAYASPTVFYYKGTGKDVTQYGYDLYYDKNCSNKYDDPFYLYPENMRIIVKDGETFLPYDAFLNWRNVSDFVIPESVKVIGKDAFSCTTISTITLPSGITRINDKCFDGCQNLKNITIPSKVTSMGDAVFEDCKSLTDVTLPDGLKSIGEAVFVACESLSSIKLPDSLTSMGQTGFQLCTSLQSISVPDGITELKEGTFADCLKLTDVKLPKNLRIIGKSAFNGDSSLENITIPPSVEEIGKDAFNYDKKLTISGYENTLAQKYAKANNIPFKSLGAVPAGMYNGATFKGSLTLDTTSYIIPPKASYQIGVRIRGTSDKLKVYSSSPSVASVTKLSNGNYKVTGMESGTTYIMFDLYNQGNQREVHASVKITVQKNAAPHGNAARQVALVK